MQCSMKRLYILLMLLLLPGGLLLAQSSHRLASQSYFTIEGTSPLHDWSMKTEELEGCAALETKSGKLLGVKQLQVKFRTKSLRSGKRLMEKKAWEALKADEYSIITFQMASQDGLNVERRGSLLVVEGTITIGGITRHETLEAEATISSEGTITLCGRKALRMSDFQIAPPSLLFGQFTADDALTINFNLVLTPNPLYTQK